MPNRFLSTYRGEDQSSGARLEESPIEAPDKIKMILLSTHIWHLVFSFAGILAGSGTLEPFIGSSEYISIYKKFNGLKETDSKFWVAIGGW